MARKILTNLDLNSNQLLNAVAQILATDPSITEGRFFYHSGTGTFRFQTGATTLVLGRLDQISAPTADVSMNGNKLTNLAEPTAAQDAATRNYADLVSQGISDRILDPVRVAVSANVDIAAPGGTLDGVTMAAGDRALLYGQTTTADRDVWAWNGAAVAMTRTTDDTDPVTDGTIVSVQEGTSAGWVMIQTAARTGAKGTWSQAWQQFSTGTTYTAGTGLTLTGTEFSLTTPVAVGSGGTGSGTAAGARTNLNVPSRFAATIGDGAATSIAVTHNLGTRDVVVSVHDATTFAEIECDVTKTDANTVHLGFTAAPALNSLRAVVIG